ncbi:MAG: hypothetical protein JW731_16570 [Bacteroidales bacterium]|nr:hypothetical protein [Bacteroidales bacterium]
MLLLFSCLEPENRFDIDASKVDVNQVKIKRYEQALFNLDPNHLKEGLRTLQPEFPIFLEGDVEDTISLMRIREFINDTLLQSVYVECNKVFPNLGWLQDNLTEAFRHYLFYFPDRNQSQVYSYISGFDFENPVGFFDNSMLIALDLYLDSDYPAYQELGVPVYITHRFSKEFIVRDCMEKLAEASIDGRLVKNDLLDQMVYQGKILYFINCMIPEVADSILFVYTEKQLEWIRENEGSVWAFLVENQLFYNTEMQYYQKFLLDSPFTSFFGNESPPRLGWWIGYHIVSNYMENKRNVKLADLMQDFDAQKILNASGYKPQLK